MLMRLPCGVHLKEDGSIKMKKQKKQQTESTISDRITIALQQVLDPELGISVWDLGLIYDVAIAKDGRVTIVMTVTSVGCPLFGTIEQDIIRAVTGVPGVTAVHVELTFEPAWSMDKMSASARMQLGMTL